MTPEQAKEFLPILKAYSEGKQIQYKHQETGFKWANGKEFSFIYDPEHYRIKPDIIKYKRYLIEDADGNIFLVIYQPNVEPFSQKEIEEQQHFRSWIDKDWVEIECPI